MGLGDDLLFLGKAEEVYKQTGQKITPVHGKGWSPLFDNVEFLVKTGGLTINSRDTNKPSDIHIDYYEEKKIRTDLGKRIIYRPFTPSPFRIRLSEIEREEAKETLHQFDLDRFIIINPS